MNDLHRDLADFEDIYSRSVSFRSPKILDCLYFARQCKFNAILNEMNTFRVTAFVVAAVLGTAQCFDKFTNPDFAYRPDPEDGVCMFKGNGSAGVCRPVNQCPGAVSEYKMFKLVPTHCGFSGRVPVVCCSSEAPIQPSAEPSQPLPKPQFSIGSERTQNRISVTRELKKSVLMHAIMLLLMRYRDRYIHI